jgi:hypothetical protein
LGFKCGNVYDTKTGEFHLGKALCLRRIRIELACVVRCANTNIPSYCNAGSPDDMLDKKLPHTMAQFKLVDEEKEEYLFKFLESIMPDAEMSEYILNWLSYVVSGERNDHQFVNFIGKVQNGKSILLHLFK